MSESIGLYVIPVDSALGLFSLTAMVNLLEKVNTHVTVPQWRNGAWAHPPRDLRRTRVCGQRNNPPKPGGFCPLVNQTVDIPSYRQAQNLIAATGAGGEAGLFGTENL